MNKIPSEFIEPYLSAFLNSIVEGVGCGWKKPVDARADLKGVERFINIFGGIHSRLVISNEYGRFMDLSDEDMLRFCKEACEN